MSREQVFDSEIKKFFDVSLKILESYSKTFLSLHANPDNHTLRNLQRYRIVYNMTTPDDHIPYFQKLFRNYRSELLEILKEDKWLIEGSVVIQYGEDFEDEVLRKRAEKRKIELSQIYKYAVQLKKSVEESLRGLPESVQEQSQELIYPDIFLLHLFRILYAIYPQNKEVQKVVQTLEKDLGISSNQRKMNPVLEGLAENAKSLFGGVLPGNLKIPSNEEMSQKLEEAFKDPVVNETLGATVNSLMSAKNLGEGLGAALKTLENPKFMDGILKAVQTLIPAETLDSIMKSTEQLKESGEVKEALGKLGLPSEIDISKMLSDGGKGIDLSKMLNINQLANAISQETGSSVESLEEPQDSVVETSESNSEQVTQNTSTVEGLQENNISKETPDLQKMLGGVNPEMVLQSLMKNVPSDFQNLLTQMMKQQGPVGSGTPTQEVKSLIDLDNL
jgi:hypothetical protein